MYIVADFEEQIMREIDALGRLRAVATINLGGVSGSGGGAGGPPGGFIGQLAQKYVTFDTSELADSTIPVSGASLVTNLNRIRAGTALGDGIIYPRHLASGIVFPVDAAITVENAGGINSYPDISTIRFTNVDVELVNPSLINITGYQPPFSGAVGSGYKVFSWYTDGATVSGIPLAHIYQIPEQFYPVAMTTVCQITSVDAPLEANLLYSYDAITWNVLNGFGLPAGNYTNTITLPSGGFLPVGTYLSIQITNAPESQVFEDVSFNLWGIGEVITTSGTGGTLPSFTPKRVPFADNVTGLLTESNGLVLDRADNSNVLVVGADDYTHIGGSTQKAGVYIIREDIDGGLVLETFSDTTYAPSVAGLRARGTKINPAALLQNDVLFRFTGRGYGATNWANSPRFRLESRATEDWTDSAQGSKAIIGVTRAGEAATTDIFTVDGDGLDIFGQIVASTMVQCSGLIITGASPVAGRVWTAVDGTGLGTWSTLPSGIIGTTTNYDPNKIPTLPSIYDDEFNDDNLNVKWSVAAYDSLFNLRQTDGSKHLSESIHHGYVTFQGTWDFIGTEFNQVFAPADDNWTLVTHILPGTNWDINGCVTFGIYGADTSHYYHVRVGTSTSDFNDVDVLYNDGAGDIDIGRRLFSINNGLYVMITKFLDGSDHKYSVFLSANGITWSVYSLDVILTTLTTADLTTQYFGCYNPTNNPIHAIDFIRYWPETAKFDIGGNP